MKPEFFLSFAMAHDLLSLSQERTRIGDVITESGGGVHRPDGDLTVAQMETIFKGGAKNLVVFHYSGHAGEKGLYNKDARGQEYLVVTYEELADKLSAFENLKMVFINGCESQKAADWFFEKSKIDALICTQTRVNDQVAMNFAVSFYPKLLSNNDLNTAFEGAKKLRVRHGGRAVRGTDRGESDDDVVSEFVIKYRDNNAELGKTTFNYWKEVVSNTANQLTQPKETTTTVKPLGLDSSAYLLCNRSMLQEMVAFQIGEKLENNVSEPLFLFINEEESHCPDAFFQRLSAYSFQSILATHDLPFKTTPQPIALPSMYLNMKKLDKAQLDLKEKYAKIPNWGETDALQQWQLKPLTPDNDFWVVHHDLDLVKAVWSPLWADFWQFYVNDWAKQLAGQFSKRLIVVTTCTIKTQNKGFADCFDSLASSFSNVLNLNSFDKIIYDHIVDWQKDVFKEMKFKSETLIPKENTEGVFFFDIKDQLIQKLTEFTK